MRRVRHKGIQNGWEQENMVATTTTTTSNKNGRKEYKSEDNNESFNKLQKYSSLSWCSFLLYDNTICTTTNSQTYVKVACRARMYVSSVFVNMLRAHIRTIATHTSIEWTSSNEYIVLIFCLTTTDDAWPELEKRRKKKLFFFLVFKPWTNLSKCKRPIKYSRHRQCNVNETDVFEKKKKKKKK